MPSGELGQEAARPSSRRLAQLGPRALITGASEGIGAATARALAAEGFDLVPVARRQDLLDRLARELEAAHGTRCLVIVCDLASARAALQIVDALARAGVPMGDIGIAVRAAGYGSLGPRVDADIESERAMIRLNCEAVLHLCQILARTMAARGAGQLVLFGSIAGFEGNALTANYSATKAYVQSLAEGLAVELRPLGVHVLCVSPGPVATGFDRRAGMSMPNAGTSDAVARDIVRALGRSGTIRPGLLSKLLGYNLAPLPRAMRVRVMSRIMQGMAPAGAGGARGGR